MKSKLIIIKRYIKNSFRKIYFLFFSLIISIFFFLNISNISYFLANKSYGVGEYSFYNLNLAQKLFLISASTRDFDFKDCNIEIFKKNLCFDRPVQWSNHQLARTYFVQGKFDQALFYINRELELYPESIQAHYVKALIFGFTNRELEGIKHFSIFADVYKDAWAPRVDKSWLQFRVGDYEGGLKTLNEIADKYKDNAWVQNSLGVMMMNTAKSKEDLKKAREALTLANLAAKKLTEEDWGHAYTGNDPRIYFEGLTEMRESIESNLLLVDKKLADYK